MPPLNFLGQSNHTEIQHNIFGYMMPLALASHDTNSIVNGNGASTGSSTSTKCHMIPLNNHLNITNAMVSLMAPSASCFWHVLGKNLYVSQVVHISYTCQLVHVQIWHTSIYISPMNVQQSMMWMVTLVYIHFMLLAHGTEQICPSNDTYARYFICRYDTTMSVYLPHKNSMQWTMWPWPLACIHSTWVIYAPEQVSWPHCTFVSHCSITVVYIETPYSNTDPLKSILCNIYQPNHCKTCVRNMYNLQM